MKDIALTQLHKVRDQGFCSGCGACAYSLGIPMTLDQYGEYLPALEKVQSDVPAQSTQIEHSCPFLSPQLNEDILAGEHFAQDCSHHSKIGFYHSVYGGYVSEGSFRENGTSGGMGSWIGAELMRRGEIDGVIHIKPLTDRTPGEPFFRYTVSRSVQSVTEGAKTRYHAVEISEVMKEVRRTPGRYLFIGVPCFCKAVRRLQKIDPIISERVVYVLSLVCGHLKSMNWTLALGWAAGIAPDELEGFQYRTKAPDIPARAYVFTAFPRLRPDEEAPQGIRRNASTVPGGKFNLGAMMLNACDYCDDVVGETADISIGDAWLPRFETDSQGTNLIIVRRPELADVLEEARAQERVWIAPITADEAAASQSGGFRHRREGLSYRLAKAKAAGTWTPTKRIAPEEYSLSTLRKKIYDARAECSRVSREAFVRALATKRFSDFSETLQPFERRLRRLEVRSSLFRALRGRAHRILIIVLRRFGLSGVQ